jgi:hypothetical protein
MSTEVIIWKIVVVLCICIILYLVDCVFDANSVLNWYIKEFHKAPRVNKAPRRKKHHERFLRLFTFPIREAKNYTES